MDTEQIDQLFEPCEDEDDTESFDEFDPEIEDMAWTNYVNREERRW